MIKKHTRYWRLCSSVLLSICYLLFFTAFVDAAGEPVYAFNMVNSVSALSANAAFTRAEQEMSVPAPLLKALCFMEGHLSNHAGHPSLDNGFGCMHLIKNQHADLLDQAATELKVSSQQLKLDLATNIRGGAAILRDDALQLSATHTLPVHLADWYGAVAAYSHATTHATALLYANAVYKLLNTGFSGLTDGGEKVIQAAQPVQANTKTARNVTKSDRLPAGCSLDNAVDYAAAVDCILDPNVYDCNVVSASYPHCTYEDANRPDDYPVNYIVIHDSEGTLQSDLHTFQNHNSGVSIHYIVDVDGTVYQLLNEADIGYHAGNYWYNQHAIGIEHPDWDATGYRWYNAAQYLGSARLAAYLLQKYDLPLDHEHILSHATIPSDGLFANHVDPGPYWLWTYYLDLIHQQGVPYPDTAASDSHIFTLTSWRDRRPLGQHGRETPANFNFFYLYKGPSTRSGLIPQITNPTVFIDSSDSVETNMSYYALSSVKDPAGTGATMIKIWYGENDQAHSKHRTLFQTAHQVWLAVPPGARVAGSGTAVSLSSPDGGNVQIFGQPGGTTPIGTAPDNSIFVSGYSLSDDTTGDLWDEINYNHRQAWVPDSMVTFVNGN